MKTANKTIRMPVELIEKLEEQAKKEHRTFTGQVVHLLSGKTSKDSDGRHN